MVVNLSIAWYIGECLNSIHRLFSLVALWTSVDCKPNEYNFWYNLRHTEMKRIQQHQSRQICRRIARFLLAFAAIRLPLAARTEKANVFFIHGANVSEQDACAWAAEMLKRQWQAVAIQDYGMQVEKLIMLNSVYRTL